jgi:hypothetical protein
LNKDQLLEIGIQKRDGQINLTWQQIADTYGEGKYKNGELLRSWVKNQVLRGDKKNLSSPSSASSNKVKQENNKNTIEYKETIEIHKDGTQSSNKLVRMSLEDTKNPEFLLRAHGYDPESWVLVSARSNIWNAFSKATGVLQLYASKISVKPSVENELIELQKQKIKVQDQRREFNELIKKQARFEHLKEEINKSILELSKSKPLTFEKQYFNKHNNVRANVLWSDWHYGSDFKNSLNTYNSDVFKNRIQKLMNETILYGTKHDVETLTVGALGDFLSGAIHVSSRVQASENVIQQIQVVAETMAECLVELSKHFRLIRFINIMGNHARLIPDKTQSLLNENLEKLIPWYLNSRLKDFKNIDIYEDTDGYFVDETFNPQHVYLHGDLDHVSSTVKNISQVLGITPSYVFGGHIHHQTLKEFGRTKVITSSSLMGVDDYAISKRFYAEPAQLMHIFHEDGRVKYQIPIYLE